MRRLAVLLPFVCAFGVSLPAFAQIQNLQNTNNTLDVVNPNGPSSILNLRIPLSLLGHVERTDSRRRKQLDRC